MGIHDTLLHLPPPNEVKWVIKLQMSPDSFNFFQQVVSGAMGQRSTERKSWVFAK